MMKNKYFLVFFILQIIFTHKYFAQDNPFDINQYNFVRYEKNQFHFPGDSSNFEYLCTKFDSLILAGSGNVKIVQIGDSHTQADIASSQFRKRIQTFSPGLNAGRGFVFPYRMIRTNNPWTYQVSYTGEWNVCRNVDWKKSCTQGVTGIQATTKDCNAQIKFVLRTGEYMYHDFNKIKIFHDYSELNFDVDISENVNKTITRNDSLGYTLIELDKHLTSFQLKFIKTSEIQDRFTLYGISLENEDPGVLYHSIGVNGASTQSFIQGAYFIPQLKLLSPDWVIIALGTNDANSKVFPESIVESNYEHLIKLIREAAPNAEITLYVPNDAYFYRRRPNENVAKLEKVIFRLARKYNCSVWNLYQIMGGFNSSVLWYKNFLMAGDKVHFSVPGYVHIGDLFFLAFLKSYENHIYTRNSLQKLNR